MSERLFTRLAARLAQGEALALACVVAATGATPRRRGALMLVGADDDEGSVGGGEAEARVVAAARALLRDGGGRTDVAIDLSGRPGAAGVCGGRMDIVVRAWRPADSARAQAISATLASGHAAMLAAGDAGTAMRIEPDPRLLVVGAGHCGRALCRLARELDFDVWVHDARAACFERGAFEGATVLCGDASRLSEALATPRPVFAVLLNRDYAADVAALEVIAPASPVFLGMMGSRRRVAQVRAALPHLDLGGLVAPIGLEIGAETPSEIAVSILAQLVACGSGESRDALLEDHEQGVAALAAPTKG
jgi:xanthine dehydrogenase accessory factor